MDITRNGQTVTFEMKDGILTQVTPYLSMAGERGRAANDYLMDGVHVRSQDRALARQAVREWAPGQQAAPVYTTVPVDRNGKPLSAVSEHVPAEPNAVNHTRPMSDCTGCGKRIAWAVTDRDDVLAWRTAEITDANGHGKWCMSTHAAELRDRFAALHP